MLSWRRADHPLATRGDLRAGAHRRCRPTTSTTPSPSPTTPTTPSPPASSPARPATIERRGRELRAGNVYVNRHIVGAVVGRQPFGGYGLSGVGSKAGGPDYLLQFVEPRVVTENTLRQGFAPRATLAPPAPARHPFRTACARTGPRPSRRRERACEPGSREPARDAGAGAVAPPADGSATPWPPASTPTCPTPSRCTAGASSTPAQFWEAVWDDCGVLGATPAGCRSIRATAPSPAHRFFPGARLNFAENLLAGPPDAADAGHPVRAGGRRAAAAVLGAAARQRGRDGRRPPGAAACGPGDRVAAWMPNVPETVVVMLAATRHRRDLLVDLARLRRRPA